MNDPHAIVNRQVAAIQQYIKEQYAVKTQSADPQQATTTPQAPAGCDGRETGEGTSEGR